MRSSWSSDRERIGTSALLKHTHRPGPVAPDLQAYRVHTSFMEPNQPCICPPATPIALTVLLKLPLDPS